MTLRIPFTKSLATSNSETHFEWTFCHKRLRALNIQLSVWLSAGNTVNEPIDAMW